jgi:hypothetical protein
MNGNVMKDRSGGPQKVAPSRRPAPALEGANRRGLYGGITPSDRARIATRYRQAAL